MAQLGDGDGLHPPGFAARLFALASFLAPTHRRPPVSLRFLLHQRELPRRLRMCANYPRRACIRYGSRLHNCTTAASARAWRLEFTATRAMPRPQTMYLRERLWPFQRWPRSSTPSACVRSTNPKAVASEESQMKDSADGPQASEPTGEIPFGRRSDVESFPEAV